MCEMFSHWKNYQHQKEETLREKHEQAHLVSVSRHDAA